MTREMIGSLVACEPQVRNRLSAAGRGDKIGLAGEAVFPEDFTSTYIMNFCSAGMWTDIVGCSRSRPLMEEEAHAENASKGTCCMSSSSVPRRLA